MTSASIALGNLIYDHTTWRLDWLLGCILIVVTVIFHVLALGFLNEKAITIYGRGAQRHNPIVAFAIVIGATALLATIFHAVEAAIWAVAYCLVGTMSNVRLGMLYSLSAMTTYGHTDLVLDDRWKLMGALEALDGWLLFGLTTAFLFWMIQEVSPTRRSSR